MKCSNPFKRHGSKLQSYAPSQQSFTIIAKCLAIIIDCDADNFLLQLLQTRVLL